MSYLGNRVEKWGTENIQANVETFFMNRESKVGNNFYVFYDVKNIFKKHVISN